MTRFAWLLGLVVACGSVESKPDGGGGTADAAGGGADAAASVDAAPGSADAAACLWTWRPSNVDPCVGVRPTGSLNLAAGIHFLDTTTAMLDGDALADTWAVPAAEGDALVVNTRAFVVGPTAVLHVRGERPLIVLVEGNDSLSGIASIQGRLLVSAYSITANWYGGPGADRGCATSGRGSEPTAGQQDGGGGGGFGAQGGRGGAGGMATGTPGAGGDAASDLDLSPLRGGCRGARGAALGEDGSLAGGAGGTAGGGVQIAARGEIIVSGSIEAAGGPGLSGQNGGVGVGGAGSGGGGSGGAILLEAGTIRIEAAGKVCANGGSGAEGAGASFPGDDGEVGSCDDSVGAIGRDGAGLGGKGGDGGFALVPEGGNGGAGTQTSSSGGGGGGGGAVGRVILRGFGAEPTVDGAAIVTPAAQRDCVGC